MTNKRTLLKFMKHSLTIIINANFSAVAFHAQQKKSNEFCFYI